jgi:hypothetical protein
MRATFVVRSLLVVLLSIGLGASAARAGGGHSNWGDLAFEAMLGSAQVGVQKRLSQGGLEQWKCRVCAHYVEAWVESDEVDAGARDRDVTTIGLGYRFYFLTGDENPNRREGLAAFMRLGLSRVELDTPNTTRSGYYGGLGIQYPILESSYRKGPKAGSLRPFWLSVVLTATQNEIETDAASLDYVSTKVGLRFVFPSKRDKRRAACLNERIEQVRSRITDDQLQELLAIGTTEDFAAAIAEHSERLELPRPASCFEPDAEYGNEP